MAIRAFESAGQSWELGSRREFSSLYKELNYCCRTNVKLCSSTQLKGNGSFLYSLPLLCEEQIIDLRGGRGFNYAFFEQLQIRARPLTIPDHDHEMILGLADGRYRTMERGLIDVGSFKFTNSGIYEVTMHPNYMVSIGERMAHNFILLVGLNNYDLWDGEEVCVLEFNMRFKRTDYGFDKHTLGLPGRKRLTDEMRKEIAACNGEGLLDLDQYREEMQRAPDFKLPKNLLKNTALKSIVKGKKAIPIQEGKLFFTDFGLKVVERLKEIEKANIQPKLSRSLTHGHIQSKLNAIENEADPNAVPQNPRSSVEVPSTSNLGF